MYPSRGVSRGMGHRYHKNTTKARQRIGLYHRITTIKHQSKDRVEQVNNIMNLARKRERNQNHGNENIRSTRNTRGRKRHGYSEFLYHGE